jgi:hypothetical protein
MDKAMSLQRTIFETSSRIPIMEVGQPSAFFVAYPDMRKIELAEKDSEGSQPLIVDGELWKDSYGSTPGNSYDRRFCAGFCGSALGRLTDLTIEELLPHLQYIAVTFRDAPENPGEWQFGSLEMSAEDGDPTIEVLFQVDFNRETWAAPYSLSDLAAATEKVVAGHRELGYDCWQGYGEPGLNKFGVSRTVLPNTTIGDLIAKGSSLAQLRELVADELSKKSTISNS